MRNQEIFDKVATHLLTQNEKAEDGGCRYRQGNLSCAAGCLIPDELYDESKMENETINTLMDEFGPMRVFGFEVDQTGARLICSLQIVHDSSYGPEYWLDNLKGVAKEYGLKFNLPTEKDPSCPA